MIQLPKRSVTRFFIPLIDVLILLFAMFLLLPIVDDRNKSAIGEEGGDTLTREQVQDLKKRLAKADQELKDLKATRPTDPEARERIRRLEEQLKELPQELWIRTLQISPKDGSLSYTDRGGMIPIRMQDDALNLIQNDKKKLAQEEKENPLKNEGKRQLLYIIQYPRDLTSAYPLGNQLTKYQRWFKDVSFRFDIPDRGLAGGKS